MTNPSQPSFDHEATREELAGVGENRRFDEVIDDEEVEDLQIICKRGGEEIPIAKPSRALLLWRLQSLRAGSEAV